MNHKNIFLPIFSMLFLSCMQPILAMETADERTQETNAVLIKACEKRNFGLVKYLIEKGANVNTKDKYDITLLHYACKNKDHVIVEYLLEKGANINSEGCHKWTALHIVCELGFYDLAQYLIEQGANIFAEDSEKLSPLYVTCIGSTPNISIIKLLLKKGADINARGYNNNTLLHVACERAFNKVIEFLIKKGAHLNVKNNAEATPLHIACVPNNPNLLIIKTLIESGADVNAQGAKQITPLHIVCQIGFYKGVQYLVQNGAHVHAETSSKVTPLHLACKEGFYDCIEFLIKHGAHVNAENNARETPLHMACSKGIYKIIEYLIKQGAQVNTNGYGKSTPLTVAAYAGHLDIVKLLIRNKANLHCNIDIFPTPLHAASASGQMHVVRYLLDSFPELNDMTTKRHSLSALDYAYMFNKENIVQLFAYYGARIISEKEAEENMHVFFAELDQETLQKQVKREQHKQNKLHNKKLENQNNKDSSHKNSPITHKKIKPTINNNVSCVLSSTLIEPILTVNSTETTITTSYADIINSSDLPTTLSSPVICNNNSVVLKNTITITPKKQHNIAPALNNKFIQVDVHNEYQIGHDKKLKWPRSLYGTQYDSIRDHLRQLKHWPKTAELDIKLLKGQSGMWRLRVGSYRLLFTVNDSEHKIIINEIGLRKKIYKGL